MAFVIGIGNSKNWVGKAVNGEQEKLEEIWNLNYNQVKKFVSDSSKNPLNNFMDAGETYYTNYGNAKWTDAYIFDENNNVYVFASKIRTEQEEKKADKNGGYERYKYALVDKYNLKEKMPDWAKVNRVMRMIFDESFTRRENSIKKRT